MDLHSFPGKRGETFGWIQYVGKAEGLLDTVIIFDKSISAENTS